ncbi:MAG: ABC transporter permease [Candidatus Heimdallarchaeota archaeon]|nr:ABC transporter permease [Candidatus Heimdallarchaeota archaeon]MBY8995698.1 ABC transporter permease [Candidatus Heimdallarchaeota archaeon]
MRMTWLVAKRVSKFILRDPRLIALMLIVPIVMSLVIGYGFSGEIKNIDVLAINLDESTIEVTTPLGNKTISVSNTMIDYLDESDEVDITPIEETTILDWNASKQSVLDGEFYGAIMFPVNFTVDLFSILESSSGIEITIDAFIDNSNPQIGGAILKILSESLENIMGGSIGLSINAEFAFDEGLTQLQYMMPSILPFAVFFMSFILSIISLISERKAGTLDLLLLSPYRKVNIMLGYLIPLSVVSVIQASILLILTIFAFNVPVIGGAGAYFAIYFMLLLMGMCGMVLGFLLSTFAKTELQAIQFIPMVTFTMLLLSGILVPLETLPNWLLPISYILPLTHGAEYLRTVMIEGTGFLWHWQIAPVIGFIVLLLLLSSLTLRESK